MKILISSFVIIISLITFNPLSYAEKGEVEHLLGVGSFFPTGGIAPMGVQYFGTPAALLVGFQTFFGLSDNWDLGIKLNWSYFNDGEVSKFSDPDNPNIKGQLYFDYQRWTLGALARWNFFPGHLIAPHLIFGGGATFDIYKNQTLYTSLLPVNYSDSTKISWQAQGGLDVNWRFWGPLMFKVETLYVYSPLSQGVELMFWFGVDWFIKSTNIR